MVLLHQSKDLSINFKKPKITHFRIFCPLYGFWNRRFIIRRLEVFVFNIYGNKFWMCNWIKNSLEFTVIIVSIFFVKTIKIILVKIFFMSMVQLDVSRFFKHILKWENKGVTASIYGYEKCYFMTEVTVYTEKCEH